MTPPKVCSICGCDFLADTLGDLCPACLLRVAMNTGSAGTPIDPDSEPTGPAPGPSASPARPAAQEGGWPETIRYFGDYALTTG